MPRQKVLIPPSLLESGVLLLVPRSAKTVTLPIGSGTKTGIGIEIAIGLRGKKAPGIGIGARRKWL
jgi:hypothetical protein